MEENRDQSKTSSKPHRPIFLIVGLIIIGLVILAGVSVTAFGLRHFNNLGRGFGAPQMMSRNNFGSRGMGGRDILKKSFNGQVTAINGQDITLKTNDNQELAVKVSDTTSYYKGQNIAKAADLQVNNSVVVSGSPDSNGVIQATAIQIK